jgi:UDP-N-acetylmuramoylalanine--D-glutamate ligase
MAGNMGIPLFDIISEITPETIIVCELSSHQLEYVHHPPHTGVLLNLFEEHLDHYADYLSYQRAKMNIFGEQADSQCVDVSEAERCRSKIGGSCRIAIYNADDTLITERFREIKFAGVRQPFGADTAIADSAVTGGQQGGTQSMRSLLDAPCALTGEHNALNRQAAILAVRAAGVTDSQIKSGLKTFQTLPHRLQYIGEVGGIHFFDDSISTIPQAAVAAIESVSRLPFVNGTGSIILGGFDRGIDYGVLVEYLRRKPIRNIAFTGQAGRRIKELLRQADALPQNMIETDSYADIVEWCKLHTGRGNACILSPAAASYDRFKNFEQRGMVFKSLVLGEV